MNGMKLLLDTAEKAAWMDVPREALEMAKEASGPVLSFCSFLQSQGIDPPEYVWYNPLTKTAGLNEDCPYVQKYLLILEKFASKAKVFDELPPRFGKESWMLIKTSASGEDDEGWKSKSRRKKTSDSADEDEEGGFLSDLALAALLSGGLLGSLATRWVVKNYSPAAAAFGGALFGGSVGGLAGLVGEKVYGLRRGTTMKRFIPVGAILGALPGAYLGYLDWRASSGNVQNPIGADLSKPPPVKAAAWEMVKEAQNETGVFFGPSINVDKFNRVVWDDPLTPVPVRAATAGLVESASQLQGGAKVISPYDITKIAVGMGSGWMSGKLVGKVLGALAGLPERAQKELQQAGIWAGFLKNTVPNVFLR